METAEPLAARLALALGGLALLAAGASWSPARDAEPIDSASASALAFDARHHDSRPHDEGFVEVWEVTLARATVLTATVTATLDGAPVALAWERDADGVASAGDRFSFVGDAYDRANHVVLSSTGSVVWEARYFGGSGTPLAT